MKFSAFFLIYSLRETYLVTHDTILNQNLGSFALIKSLCNHFILIPSVIFTKSPAQS